jgi:hypothetical protein
MQRKDPYLMSAQPGRSDLPLASLSMRPRRACRIGRWGAAPVRSDLLDPLVDLVEIQDHSGLPSVV